MVATELRPLICPQCARFIGATDRERGIVQLFCRGCRKWRVIDVAAPLPDRWRDQKPRTDILPITTE